MRLPSRIKRDRITVTNRRRLHTVPKRRFSKMIFTLVLITLILTIKLLTRTKLSGSKIPPSPSFQLPLIGHLHLMAGYEVPYQAFTKLALKYGEVFGLQLGFVKCVVVNGQKNIREALVTKGHHFDSRPDFRRYQQLFCGNKENSLAFCDWSSTQKTRRDMLKAYTFPRAFTNKFHTLEDLIREETHHITSNLTTGPVEIKPLILKACANIFTAHFCTRRFPHDDPDISRLILNYDDIFFEVNQGYAADFLPFLMPFHSKNLRRVNDLTHQIRRIVLEKIIQSRFEDFGNLEEPGDYVESLISHVKSDEDLTWESALFALEDIIGGHSAVGNFLVKLLAFLVNEPEVQRKIQEEILANIGTRDLTIADRNLLPYTEASIYEAIRLIASPIVPRVANRDSTIGDLRIERGTVIFLNNYDLSMSRSLWDDPEKFKPERFLREGRLVKPEHFLPFGGGRRSCMGYKMVQLVSFGILGGLLQKYDILKVENCCYKVPVGSLALPRDTFRFRFEARR